jgi:hypothetical protein
MLITTRKYLILKLPRVSTQMLIYKFLVPVLIYKWLIYSYLSKFRKILVRVTGASCSPPAWQQDRRVAAAAASLSGSPLLPLSAGWRTMGS